MKAHTITPVLISALLLASTGSQSLATTNYVDISNLTPVSPYTSWATSATNIQDAIDVTSDGDTVLVDDGVYYLDSTIVITNSITLQSFNTHGAIIDGSTGGSWGTRCLNLGGSACRVVRFVIRNGFVLNIIGWGGGAKGGGVYCTNNVPEVVGCYIHDCTAAYGGGMYYGTSKGCTFYSNSGHYGGGQYGGVSYQSAFYRNDAITCNIGISGHGGGMQSGTAYNSLFYKNRAILGGGLGNSTAYNCTIIENSVIDIVQDELGEITVYYGSGGGIKNSTSYNTILCSNTYYSARNNSRSSSGYYSCSPDFVDGVDGCITNAPFFADSPNWWEYKLSSGSPCINAGNNSFVSTTSDMVGNDRIINGTVDMGAFESAYENNDADNDGILDSWETDFFGHSSNCVATIDGDLDGHNNLQEFICGTDPTNSASCFMITNCIPLVDDFIIEWPSVSGRIYSAFWTDNLTNSFVPLESGMAYPCNSCTDTVHAGEAQLFYRLEVERSE